jgi:small GTP-binding protein
MNNTKKVVLIGHFGVGKSSLIKRFVENVFSDNYIVTIGVHISKKSIQIEGKDLTFVLWDIEGKDDLKKVRPAYLIGTSGFIYVIDPTRVQTYQNFEEEFDFIQTSFPDASIITVANKSDLINIDDFQKQIDQYRLKLDFMTSAKTGELVNEIFLELGKEIIE